jgi:pantothenate kinase
VTTAEPLPTAHELVARAIELARTDERVLIGIAGSPGSGKTTSARVIAAGLRAAGVAAIAVPMDGFHLSNRQLDLQGTRDRKGAIETFDGAGFVAAVRRLRDEPDADVYLPDFEREADEPVAARLRVGAEHRVVVVEGNYLLDAAPPWADLAAILDEVWFCATPDDVRLARLVERHTRHGRSPVAALAWARDVDGANAARIEPTRARAVLGFDGRD